MRKLYLYFVLCILLLSFHVFIVAAQSKTVQQAKNQGNAMVITVSGIEYDNPNFVLLKENLKTNSKVKSITTSYAQQTAKISFTYNGTGADLWDEVPGNIQQLFRLATMEDHRLELTVKNTGNTAGANNTKPDAVNEDDCKCCSYFPLCKYDDTRSFQGIIYKGITFDNGMYYYYCNNGTLTQKQVTLNGTEIKSVYTQTILKCSAPAGTTWSETDVNGATNQHTIISKGISVAVNGNTYKDVMVVYHKTYSQSGVSISQNNYYANGTGLIKTEVLSADYDPAKAAAEKVVSDSIFAALPGSFDESIVGTWAFYDNVMNWKLYYKFNADGTWQYYAGSVSAANEMYAAGKNYWHVNGDHLELWYGSLSKHLSWILQKKNDPATGKPTLIIQFKGTENRIYFSEDGKAAWN